MLLSVCRFCILFLFVLLRASAQSDQTFILYQSESSAEFKGGMFALRKFINENAQYPPAAKDSAVTGIVFLQFTILEDGSLSGLKVLRGMCCGCNEEALRIVKLTSGMWIPASTNGKPHKMQWNLPIRFKPK